MSEEQKVHDVILRTRKIAEINGVVKVNSFDEKEIQLESVMGEMIIEGEGMHVENLDTDKGIVLLSGRIDGIYYITNENSGSKGFWGRLLK